MHNHKLAHIFVPCSHFLTRIRFKYVTVRNYRCTAIDAKACHHYKCFASSHEHCTMSDLNGVLWISLFIFWPASLVFSMPSLVSIMHSLVSSMHSLVSSMHSLVSSMHSSVLSMHSLVSSMHSLVFSMHSLVSSMHHSWSWLLGYYTLGKRLTLSVYDRF